MSAATARKFSTSSAAAHGSQHGSPPPRVARRDAYRDHQDDWREAAGLLEHFQETPSKVEQTRAERDRMVRQRARRMHRPFRLRWTVFAVSAVLLGELVFLLWLNGLAQSSVRHAATLDLEIAQVRDDIERTQKKIAALDSRARLERMAAEMGWTLAEQSQFDDVTSPAPMPTPQKEETGG